MDNFPKFLDYVIPMASLFLVVKGRRGAHYGLAFVLLGAWTVWSWVARGFNSGLAMTGVFFILLLVWAATRTEDGRKFFFDGRLNRR